MIELIFDPKWFYGKEIIVDVFSEITLFLLTYFSLNYYRLNKNRNYFYLGAAFLMIGLSFLFKILTNFTIQYQILTETRFGFLELIYYTTQPTNYLFFIGFLLYRLLTLIGFYTLYGIYEKQSKQNTFLMLYFILISTYFTRFTYFIFHATSFVFLGFITMQYYSTYLKNKFYRTKVLAYSFVIIAISQIFFTFGTLYEVSYLIGEIIQLIGYVLLLATLIMVLKYGKKKK